MKYRKQINYTSLELQMMFILGSAYSIHFKTDFCHNISFSFCIFTIKTEFNEQYKRHLKFWSFHHHAWNMYEQLYLIGNNTEYRYLKINHMLYYKEVMSETTLLAKICWWIFLSSRPPNIYRKQQKKIMLQGAIRSLR